MVCHFQPYRLKLLASEAKHPAELRIVVGGSCLDWNYAEHISVESGRNRSRKNETPPPTNLTRQEAYANKIVLLTVVLDYVGAKKLGSKVFVTDPDRCRKVEEKERNHSVI